MTTATPYDYKASAIAATANALHQLDRSRGFEKSPAEYQAAAKVSVERSLAKPRPSLMQPYVPGFARSHRHEQDEWAADYRASAL